jgi:hypothetical protein
LKGAFVHEAKIAKGSSYTLAFVFYGWVKLAKNKQVTYKAMWFALMIKKDVYQEMFKTF